MAQNNSGIQSHRHSKWLVLCLALLCLGLGFVGVARTQSSDNGSQVRVVDLDLNPAPEALAAARQAYHQGAVIRMVGGAPQDLQRLLGAAVLNVSEGPTDPSSSAQQAGPQPKQIVAVRIGEDGALHQFVHLTDSLQPEAWQSAFQSWMDGEVAELSSQSAAAALDASDPSRAAWTPLEEITVSGSDGNNNNFRNTANIYRLNDVNSAWDWYMVLDKPQSQPDFKTSGRGCSSVFVACGWWTQQRIMTIKAPGGELVEHGPTSTITTETAGFKVGASLSGFTPGVSAEYGRSWSQPSVTTIDRSDSQTARWEENFKGQNTFRTETPALTARGTFFSDQAAIFKFPEGTTSFNFDATTYVMSRYYGPDILYTGDHYSPNYYRINGRISPPIFAVDTSSQIIPAGSKSAVQLTATIPASSFGLPWKLTNLPSWLTASQLTGSGSTKVTLSVAPNTPNGSEASLNFNTDPQYAAPSVETSPLKVSIKVGQPQGTGLLVVGGVNASNGNLIPLATAEFVQPQVTGVPPMQGPRMSHTATLLQNGQLLVAGGSSQANSGALATAELFDPQTGFFSPVSGSMTTSRVKHTATLLNSGKVLIAGGFAQVGDKAALATAELYDPSTQAFMLTGSMKAARANQTATLLQNGDVLIAGGESDQGAVNTAEIYHPATGTFSPAAGLMITARAYHTSTRLASGQVLLAGGIGPTGGSVATAELYNPASGTFTSTGSLNQARALHTATLLSDGQVLLTGGGQGPAIYNLRGLATAELYDPERQVFTLASASDVCPGSSGCMTTARAHHTATLLPDGTVFIVGGGDPSLSSAFGTTEIYDPVSRTFRAGPTVTPRGLHTATLIEKTEPEVSLESSRNPSSAGESVTFTATLNSTKATGSVIFKEGTTILNTATLQNGQAAFSTAKLAVGSHVITADYGGDNNFSGASTSLTQTVNAVSTSTSLSSSLNPSVYGQSVTFTAAVTGEGATGVVDFEDAGELLATVPLVRGQAAYTMSLLTAGDHAIIAVYNGDERFAASESPTLTQVVNGLVTNTTLASSANISTWGDTVTFTAHVASNSKGAPPTGTIVFLDGKTPLDVPVTLENGSAAFSIATLAAGPHSITAVYSGDSTYADSFSAEIAQSVNPAPTGTLLSSNRNPSVDGQEVIFTAGVSTPKGELRRELAGPVQLYDGDTLIGTQPYANGGATFRIPSLTPGKHAMKSVFTSTNPNFTGNTSNILIQTVTETGEQPTLAIAAAMTAPQSISLTVRNPGATEDAAITLNQLSLRTLSGSGEATLASPIPIAVGNLAPGESRSVTVMVQIPQTVRKLELIENGSFQTGNVTYQFSEGQAIVQPASR